MDKPFVPSIPNVAPARFLQEVIAELKKVSWPGRQEILKLTATVIVLSLIIGAFIGLLDITFVKLTSVLFAR